ncbi:MAG: acyl-CoA thioesterase [Desulfuromonadales bacterium]
MAHSELHYPSPITGERTPESTNYLQILPFATDPILARQFLMIDEDIVGNIRFGKILEILDKVAENTALAYVHCFYPDARVVTAAIDSIVLRSLSDTTQNLLFSAKINYVGKTSMEVGIRVEHVGPCPCHVASCYFTMVARSTTEAKSLELPPLAYPTPDAQKRFDKATARKQEYRKSLEIAEQMPSLEEYLFLKRLHKEQESPDFSGLRASKLVAESVGRAYPEQENVPKTIFGGHLIRRGYELSAIAADMVATDRAVPIRVNRINFAQPVMLGDLHHFTARVVYTGKTTIAVQCDIERISRDRSVRAMSNSCLFTFQNVGPDLETKPVPFIYPATYAEDERFLNAYRQRID